MNTNKKPNYTNNRSNRSVRKVTLQDKLEKVPEHIRNIVYVLNNNAEIRRFTSLAMINSLIAADAIKKTDKVYVKFGINKFAIILNGLANEYYYNNTLFIESFAASFIAFANNAQYLINKFCEVENKEIDETDVANTAKNIGSDNDNSPVEEDDQPTTAAE